jgi:signal transduction histidine kinase
MMASGDAEESFVNHATVVSVAAFVASILVAAVGVRLGRAAGWKDQVPFALVGFTAALYAAFNLPSTAGSSISDSVVVFATRLQLATGALHAFAWIRFAGENLGDRCRRCDAWLGRLLLAAAACFVLPGVAFTDRVSTLALPSLGVWYRLVEQTRLGGLLILFTVAVLGLLALRYIRARLAHRAGAGLLALAFGAFFLLAANDAAAVAGLLGTPMLVEVGLFLPVGAVAWISGSRFIADARELSDLRVRLEELVELRTRELHGAHEQLRRAEKLATLGEVAAGVAHEVNNPAAVVAGNLDYLRSALSGGEVPRDALECLDESSAAVRRIAGIVRQLLHAGRSAGHRSTRTLIQVAPVVREAARATRAAADHVHVDAEVPDWLHAVGEEELLLQVLVNLLVNAAQAIPPERTDGRVLVTARHLTDRVRIEVRDNGSGMSDEVLRKAFEPFFSTKVAGKGTGLGLAISRGLVVSLGGELRLESVVGEGTRALVDLPAEMMLTGGRPPVGLGGRPRAEVLS